MIPGYNTNGFAHHRPLDALRILNEIGYGSVAITVDHGWLNTPESIRDIARFLADHSMSNVIETGARFLLDPNIKHHPTLLDPDETQIQRRIQFLTHCIDLAVELNSDCVSLWSGKLHPGQSIEIATRQLAKHLKTVLNYAENSGVDIGFEPEPGMLIDTTDSFRRLLERVDSPRLKMTMDIGHLHCLGETPIADFIHTWQDRIVNVHIEDMNAGVHDHLMFGEGEIQFAPVIQSLRDIGYNHGVHVELSRHSHNAVEVARQSFEFLQPLIEQSESKP